MDVQEQVDNRARFLQALEEAYKDLFVSDPVYEYPAKHLTPMELAQKMLAAFERGSASKDGEGIKRACKACGIKQTYKAIQAFLQG